MDKQSKNYLLLLKSWNNYKLYKINLATKKEITLVKKTD